MVKVSTTTAAAQPLLTIRNNSLRVTLDRATNQFAVTARNGARPFLAAGSFPTVTGPARVSGVTSPFFGKGQEIVVGDGFGTSGRVMLFPSLPFALFQMTLKNSGTAEGTLNHVPVVSFNADPGYPVSALKTFGTGGLAAPDSQAGSYAWLAIAEPQSRNGVVAGWLTHDRASGVLLPTVEDAGVKVTARSDYGRLRLAPGQSAQSETLVIGYFADARLGLEQWASAVARRYAITLPPQPVGFCTWYAEKHGGSSDEKNLADLTDFAAKNLKPFGFTFIQIDDGWQKGDSKGNGPRKNFTDFNPEGPYPSGLKGTAVNIKAHGLTPGLWFMPFAGTFNDPWFADKQAFFVRHEDGKPYDTSWGGTSLDMTNPQARDYLHAYVSRIAKEWGVTYFKMDGLYTGVATSQIYVNNAYKDDALGDAVFADPGKTNIEAFRSGLQLVRDAAGPQVFFLGCTVAQNMRSYEGAMGLVDAMRIGQDNSGNWAGWAGASPVAGSRNYFLNGRVWYNDPDPFYVRPTLSLDEARTTASWTTVSGALNSSGDWLPDLPAERLDILKRTMPSHGKTARPVDLFENDPPRVWTVTDDTGAVRRDLVAFFNWSDQPEDFDLTPGRLGLPASAQYAAFDFWGNRFLPPFTDHLKATVPAHGCQVLAVRPVLGHPFLLSTGRHITQGMVDVVAEHWDAASRTLSGSSRVVANDPYELRVVTAGGTRTWKVVRASLSPAYGATITPAEDGLGVRATIVSSANRIISWSLSFTSTDSKREITQR